LSKLEQGRRYKIPVLLDGNEELASRESEGLLPTTAAEGYSISTGRLWITGDGTGTGGAAAFWGGGMITGDGEKLETVVAGAWDKPEAWVVVVVVPGAVSAGMSAVGVTKPTMRTLGSITVRRLASMSALPLGL
jgi:Ca2+-binding RTX toxin-like protein